MSQYVLLRGARQVLTLHGPQGARRGSALKDLAVISDGSVLIYEGVVKCVGSTRRIENLKEARDALEIDVHGCVVMPGFVDPGLTASSERACTPKVALEEAAQNGHGLERAPQIAADSASFPETRVRVLCAPKKSREIYDDNLELLRGCLQHGTLTAGISASELNGPASVVPLLRQLAKIGDNPVETIRAWRIARPLRYADEFEAFLATLEVLQRRKLAHFVEISAEALAHSTAGFLPSLQRSGIPLKIDWSEGPAESMEPLLQRVEAASVTCSTWIGEAQAQLAARLAKVMMFSPGGDIAQACGSGMRHAIDHGGAIAIMSGYNEKSAPWYSMQMAIARAVGLGRLSIEEAITAATVNAAYALGQGARTGTIEAGRRADLSVLAISDYRDLPRQFGINQVRMALRSGQVVFNRGRWKIGAHAQGLADGGVRSEHLRGAGPQPG